MDQIPGDPPVPVVPASESSNSNSSWHICKYCSIAFVSVRELINHRRKLHLQELIREGREAAAAVSISSHIGNGNASPSAASPSSSTMSSNSNSNNSNYIHRTRQLSEADQELLNWQLGQIMSFSPTGGSTFLKSNPAKPVQPTLAVSVNGNGSSQLSSPGLLNHKNSKTSVSNGVNESEQEQDFYNVVYMCKRCSDVFYDEEEFMHHERTHEITETYDCKYCCLTFAAANHRSKHERIHIRAGDRPKEEVEESRNQNGVGMSVNIHRGKPCTTTSPPPPVVKETRSHSRSSTKAKLDNNNSATTFVYKCFKCRMSFPSVEAFKIHFHSGDCKGQDVKPRSSRGSKTITTQPANAVDSNGKPQYCCRFCSKAFAHPSHRASHERSHQREANLQPNGHSSGPPSSTRGVARNSQPSSSNSTAMDRSRQLPPSQDSKNMMKRYGFNRLVKRGAKHKCQYCNRTFERANYRVFHERWHEKQMGIDVKPDVSKINLDTGTGLPPPPHCEIDSTYTSLADATGEELTVTPRIKMEVEDTAVALNGAPTLSIENNNNETSLDGPVTPPARKRKRNRNLLPRLTQSVFKCSYCTKTFPTLKRSAAHEKRRHLEKCREYKCDFCPSRFFTRNELTLHVRKHTGEKPYPCGLCEISFSQSCNRRTHWRNKHHKRI